MPINSNNFKIGAIFVITFIWHLVPEALIKHFALIQRLKIIALMNIMAKCMNISYKKYEVIALKAQMFGF